MAFRKCNIISLFLFVFLVFVIGYGYITLQDNQLAIDSKEHEIVKRRDHENVLQEQLKVVYRHAQRVEEELKNERERHKKTRIEYQNHKIQFHVNLTKIKHEGWTRFNALDSDHKMLKAEHEETKISLESLRAQYRRLSADHTRIVKESKDDYNTLKDSKDRESLSLQDRIQELYKKNVYYKQLAEQNEAYSNQLKEHLSNYTKVTEQYKDLIKFYESKNKKTIIHPTEAIKDRFATSESLKLDRRNSNKAGRDTEYGNAPAPSSYRGAVRNTPEKSEKHDRNIRVFKEKVDTTPDSVVNERYKDKTVNDEEKVRFKTKDRNNDLMRFNGRKEETEPPPYNGDNSLKKEAEIRNKAVERPLYHKDNSNEGDIPNDYNAKKNPIKRSKNRSGSRIDGFNKGDLQHDRQLDRNPVNPKSDHDEQSLKDRKDKGGLKVDLRYGRNPVERPPSHHGERKVNDGDLQHRGKFNQPIYKAAKVTEKEKELEGLQLQLETTSDTTVAEKHPTEATLPKEKATPPKDDNEPPRAENANEILDKKSQNREDNSPIIKPIRSIPARDRIAQEKNAENEKARKERMDVKKVTLEDDENGDQNLDKNNPDEREKEAADGDGNGKEAGHDEDHEENGDEVGVKEEDEEMEEKLPNILQNNEK